MTETKKDSPSGILRIYEQAIKKLPFLKYSWVLVATICIMALAGYFKLKNPDVFLYAVGVILISFLAFIFSFLTKIKDWYIKFLVYLLGTCVVIVSCALVLGLGTFIIWDVPPFYDRYLPDLSPPDANAESNGNDTTKEVRPQNAVKIDSVSQKNAVRRSIHSLLKTHWNVDEEILKNKKSVARYLFNLPKTNPLTLRINAVLEYPVIGNESSYIAPDKNQIIKIFVNDETNDLWIIDFFKADAGIGDQLHSLNKILVIEKPRSDTLKIQLLLTNRVSSGDYDRYKNAYIKATSIIELLH